MAEKVVLLNSGGFDSICLLHDLVNEGYELHPIHFLYGARNEVQQEAAVKKNDQKLGVSTFVLRIPKFSWTEGGFYKSHDRNRRDSYLEYRNLVFLSYAVSYAESIRARKVYFAAFGNDTYFDTSKDFVDGLNLALTDVQILTPYRKYNGKGKLFNKALKYGIGADDFFSCDNPDGNKKCGGCLDCKALEPYFHICQSDTPLKHFCQTGRPPVTSEEMQRAKVRGERSPLMDKDGKFKYIFRAIVTNEEQAERCKEHGVEKLYSRKPLIKGCTMVTGNWYLINLCSKLGLDVVFEDYYCNNDLQSDIMRFQNCIKEVWFTAPAYISPVNYDNWVRQFFYLADRFPDIQFELFFGDSHTEFIKDLVQKNESLYTDVCKANLRFNCRYKELFPCVDLIEFTPCGDIIAFPTDFRLFF